MKRLQGHEDGRYPPPTSTPRLITYKPPVFVQTTPTTSAPVAAGDSLPVLGVDSLAALKLQDLIRERTSVELPIVKILMDVTVEELAKLLLDEREKWEGPVEEPPAGSSVRLREEEI